MADNGLRELERKWFASGSPEDEAAYMVAAIRSGAISTRDLLVAARLRSAGFTDEELAWLSRCSDPAAAMIRTELRRLRREAEQQTTASPPVVHSVSLADYFQPIADEDLLEPLQETGVKYRKMAQAWNYSHCIAWRVIAGFTLKQHAPNAGPCNERFQYLQDWDFEDTPTQAGIVFWIPRLVPNSRNKDVSGQHDVLGRVRAEYELPEHHLSSFGSVAMLTGLILRHFELTNERVPLNLLWARTDTVLSPGARLDLGDFDEDGLYCSRWGWGDALGDGLGCFASGVELGSWDT